jgi:hypothetical protein
MNLEKVAALLGESTAASQTPGGEIGQLKELQRRHEHWGNIAGLCTLGLILVLFITLVFTQIVMKGGLLTVLGSILILLAIGAAVMGYFQFSARSLKQKLAAPQLPPPAAQLDSPRFPPAVSVTEQTTALLVEQNDQSTHEIAS